jgi:TIGR03009 family protein
LDWEQESAKVKTFECKFTRFEYDTFDPTGRRKADQPKVVDQGEIKYSAPDKAMFQIPGDRGEYWVCDGRAIYEQDALKRQMIVHRLPPELQGKAIADGPVPFLFGAKAAKLVERYYMQIITPEEKKQEQVWLEAWPRRMADAQNFKFAELILARDKNLTPVAVRIHHPNGNHYVRYALESIAINKSPGVLGGVMGGFGDPWWHPKAPRGWQTVEEPSQVPQPPMGRQTPPSVGARYQDSR